MINSINLGGDADAVMGAIRHVENPNVNLVAKLEKALGWPNERLLKAVQELSAEGRVGAFLIGHDGGRRSLVTFDLK